MTRLRVQKLTRLHVQKVSRHDTASSVFGQLADQQHGGAHRGGLHLHEVVDAAEETSRSIFCGIRVAGRDGLGEIDVDLHGVHVELAAAISRGDADAAEDASRRLLRGVNDFMEM